MDVTRVPSSHGDPKIRRVGFFVPESSTTDSHTILSPRHLSVQTSVDGQVACRSNDPSENLNIETGIGTYGIRIYLVLLLVCMHDLWIILYLLFFFSCIRKTRRGRGKGSETEIKAAERKNYQGRETGLAGSTESC